MFDKAKRTSFKCPINGTAAFHVGENLDGNYTIRCWKRGCPFGIRVMKAK